MAETHYSITDIPGHLSAILHTVEAGEPVELTRNGETVAVVLSFHSYQQMKPFQKDFWKALQTFRREYDIAHLDIEDDLFQNVREQSPGREVSV